MKKPACLLTLLILIQVGLTCKGAEPQDLLGTTTQGDRVVLHPNGKWEFVDSEKATAAKEVAKTFPENQGCPNGTQGGFLGFGRCISPGDKDFNRGSLSGKGR